jgi:DNA-binding IclR family transcriptional regulator
MVDAPGDRRPRIQSVARASALLLQVAESDSGLTVREISELLAMNRQTVYHMVHTLMGSGLLTRTSDGRYLLGLRVGTLVSGFERQLAPPEHLAPHVRRVAQLTGETAYAVGWRDDEIVVLSVARGAHALQAGQVPHGLSSDGHARASGKLLLAFAPKHLAQDYLRRHPPRPRTVHTLVSELDLEREFEQIRKDRYACDREEFVVGLSCIAVPFDRGASPFALGLSAPTPRFHESFEEYLATMREIVDYDTDLGRDLSA